MDPICTFICIIKDASGKSHTLEKLWEDFESITDATCDGIYTSFGGLDNESPCKSDKTFLHESADTFEESRSTRAVFHCIGLHWDSLILNLSMI